MSYSSYDHDDLEPASTMRIERRIYFESGKADLSEAVKLPLAELLSLRAESAAAEQEVFDRLKEQAAAWEEQAGRTLFLDKALEYARTLPVTHTANQWEAPDEYRHIRSNMVYQMDYSISENTRYDSAAQKSVPYSWTLRWSLRTNAPGSYRQAKIAGQDRKVFCQPGSTGQISEWPYQGPRPLLYGNLTGHPQGVCRLFQGQRLFAPRLHHRGRGTGKNRRASQTGGNHAAAADHNHPGKEKNRERSIFHFS